MISEPQQSALINLSNASLCVDYIGEIFVVIMEEDAEVIALALDEQWAKILALTAVRFGRSAG